MPSEKIGILLHGGHTRRMMTIEIGRQSKRDVKFNDTAKALGYVRTWLGIPAAAPPSPVAAEDVEVLEEVRQVLDDCAKWLAICANEFKDGGGSQRRRMLQSKADRAYVLQQRLTAPMEKEGK